MKTPYRIRQSKISPSTNEKEVTAFICMLQSPVLRESMAAIGASLPERFDLIHNTLRDDPPDMTALGLGWEHTEFPPDQSALANVHHNRGSMTVPGYSQTRGDIGEIWRRSSLFGGFILPAFYPIDKEIDALEDAFLNKVIGGARSKDVPGNDVLLLDARQDYSPDKAQMAIRRALQKQKPKFIKLILRIGWNPQLRFSEQQAPQVEQMFP